MKDKHMITGCAEYATAMREFDTLARQRSVQKRSVTPRQRELMAEIKSYKPDFVDLYAGKGR